MLQEPNYTTKKAIANAFNKASIHYDEHAFLQYEIAQRVLERLELVKINPATILDLGSGTGAITNKISTIYPNAKVIGIDLGFAMTKIATRKNSQDTSSNISYLCNDMEQIALQSNSLDFVFSNCTIQWSTNLSTVFAEIYRVLKPNGLFLFTTLGPNTLIELKEAWATLDNYAHVNQFLDMHHVGDILLQNKFDMPVIDQEEIKIIYTNVKKLFKDLKGMGANTITANKSSRLFTKSALAALETKYKQMCQLENNEISATFEVIYGIAWKGNNILKTCNTKITID